MKPKDWKQILHVLQHRYSDLALLADRDCAGHRIDSHGRHISPRLPAARLFDWLSGFSEALEIVERTYREPGDTDGELGCPHENTEGHLDGWTCNSCGFRFRFADTKGEGS